MNDNNVISTDETQASDGGACKKRTTKRLVVIAAIFLAVAAVITAVLLVFVFPSADKSDEEKYTEAMTLLSDGEYDKAYNLFRQLKNYNDAEDYLERFEVRYDEMSGQINENHYYTTIYDKNGNAVEETTYDRGTVLRKTSQYNDNGDLTEYICTKDGIEIYKEENIYSPDGSLSAKSFYSNGKTECTYDYSYNDNGKLVKEIFTDMNGMVTVSEYFYDESNVLIKSVSTSDTLAGVIDLAGDITREYTDGLETKVTTTDADGNVSCVTEKVYDSSNRLIRSTDTAPDGTVTVTFEAVYDENGNLLKESGSNEPFSYCDEYTYDEAGDLIKSLSVEKYDTTETTETLYDSRGNLIRRTNDDGRYITVREYSYDAMNDLVKEVSTRTPVDGGEAEVSECSYTYDDFGNLVKMKSTYASGDKYVNTYEYTGVYVVYEP